MAERNAIADSTSWRCPARGNGGQALLDIQPVDANVSRNVLQLLLAEVLASYVHL
jgi:hypothetical protein